MLLTVGVNGGDKYMNSLLENLLSDYNRNVRPVKNASDALKVKFGASLCRLIDVDEVNQVLTTSLWLEMVRLSLFSQKDIFQQWRDRKLVWNPAEWSGIHEVHIPSDQIWIPDILLYNKLVLCVDLYVSLFLRFSVLLSPVSLSLCLSFSQSLSLFLSP